jgi:hypothetical protein
LVFLDPDFAGEEPVPVVVDEVTLPVGASLELILETRIDLNESFIGDTLEARLSSGIRRDKQVLAPKGAVARGRILRLERHQNVYLLGIGWTDLEWPGGHARLNLEFQRMGLALPGQPVLRNESGDLQIARANMRVLHNVLMFWRVAE